VEALQLLKPEQTLNPLEPRVLFLMKQVGHDLVTWVKLVMTGGRIGYALGGIGYLVGEEGDLLGGVWNFQGRSRGCSGGDRGGVEGAERGVGDA
jgi:hypothetical protein